MHTDYADDISEEFQVDVRCERRNLRKQDQKISHGKDDRSRRREQGFT